MPMIALTDVHYPLAGGAIAGCVVIADWADAAACAEYTAAIAELAPYQPGSFYQRELPALRAVLGVVCEPLDAIVVDGYVWLAPGRPGLGAHLHAALGGVIPVIGVAKNRFTGADAIPVVRGDGKRPLHVTAAGMAAADAAAAIQRMHGPHRLPTLLVRADHLCRGLR